MTEDKSNNQFVIDISSSDEPESPPSEVDDEEISLSASSNDDDWSEWSCSEGEEDLEVGGDGDWDVDGVDKPDGHSMCNKVIQFIQDRSDLQELKVEECKAYLRMHKLRLAGTIEDFIERIKEHWKLKNESGEVFYPRSSFVVDCTGDVCKGDIVLFHQKVHQISGTTARNKTEGKRNVGRRTVAGRIIKESYGATRQQHTFTVEVLWSRGTKKLEPLFPLLVKGRNLYKLKTFRQLWKNEKERLEVLAEKHRRGNAARTVRAMRRTKAEAVKRKNEARQSPFKGLSRTRETGRRRKKYPNEHGKLAKNNERIHSHRFAPYSSKQNAGSRGSAPHRRYHYQSKWKEAGDGSSHGPFYWHSNENEAVSFKYSRSRGSHHSLYSTAERHSKWR